jgi:hypothetical protein
MKLAHLAALPLALGPMPGQPAECDEDAGTGDAADKGASDAPMGAANDGAQVEEGPRDAGVDGGD